MSAVGMRKAAVLLASLRPADRAWLLERMRPTWRYDLKRLVREAEQLCAGDHVLSAEVLETFEHSSTRPETPPPDRLLAGLRGLSPEWTARVLAGCAPDHLELFVASASSEQVRNVRQVLLSLPKTLPPKFCEALAEIVRDRGERELAQAGAR